MGIWQPLGRSEGRQDVVLRNGGWLTHQAWRSEGRGTLGLELKIVVSGGDGAPSPSHGPWKVKVKSLSCVRLFVTPWAVAHHTPPSLGFPRQEYWSGLPFPSPGDLPDPGIEARSPTL